MTSAGEYIALEFPSLLVWIHWTMVSSDCNGTMAEPRCTKGRIGDSQTEAVPINLFILFPSKTTSTDIVTRAGRLRELVRSSRSKFKLVWRQFSTVQFPRHQFVWKVRSVQFGALGPSASVQFVKFSSVHELFRPCGEPCELQELDTVACL